MDIRHITSDSLRRLLSLTEKKDQLINAVADVENEIVKAISGAATTVADVVEIISPRKASKTKAKRGSAKSSKKKKKVRTTSKTA